MNEACDCCEGIEQLTPKPIANRPGLNTLAYRMGTHATFLETMKARLSNYFLDIPQEKINEQGQLTAERIYPLRDLTTRLANDPSIALLDAWATVGHVLTFYQERIANEGYLRTATERRSILELARLVGYALRPGIASTVYLAYTIDPNFKDEVVIPQGARSQSVPNPGELPQSFETSDPLPTRAAWNNLEPRLNKPQNITTSTQILYFKGVETNLKPNDPLLIVFGDESTDQVFARVEKVWTDPEANRTKVTLQALTTIPQTAFQAAAAVKRSSRRGRLTPLNEYVARFSSAARIDTSELPKLLMRFANDLLETFAALAAAPASSDRDEAIKDTLSDLKRLQEILQPRVEISETDPSQYLRMLLAWITRAIAILEAAVGTPTPADQAKRIGNLFSYLSAPPPLASIPPRNARELRQSLKTHFASNSDTVLQVVAKTQPALESFFYAAYRNLAYKAPIVTKPQPSPGEVELLAAQTSTASTATVYALRVTASLFGSNAPRQPKYEPAKIPDPNSPTTPPASMDNPKAGNPLPWEQWDPWAKAVDEDARVVFLDTRYDKIQSGSESYIVLQNSDGAAVFSNSKEIEDFNDISITDQSRAAYGISGKTTKITLKTEWCKEPTDANQWESILRGTIVYAQSEKLDLALEPITDDIQGKEIELADLYNGLKAGQWLIVSGERTDIPDVTGVQGTELVMLAGVEQVDAKSPDDHTHSRIILANDLRYRYECSTVTIYGNVVKATHGETRNEVLGSGDASQVLQSFILKQPPLTYVPASNPRGVESTLHVRANDVEWHEAETLAWLGPTDHKFITKTSDDDKTTVIFGNGQQGARLPTGIENIKAVYRNGIGKVGNVKAEQISLLATRPLGVKEVINPLRATGGADKESRDQARKNAPLAVLALDRLVSTQDYADFARRFAGIGKASAARLSDGRRQIVHLTIAGADDIPIEKSDDLYRNLVKALHEFGDPYQPIQVELRELMLIVISANVRILPDYLWEAVAKNIRIKLLDTFSFERRELGQDVLLSEVISTIQSVQGVAYVDVDTLGGISERMEDGTLRTPEQIAKDVQKMVDDSEANGPISRVRANLAEGGRPAQLAFLSPDIQATLILNEVKP
jgi:predicted phage baseplate assembly protein